MVLAFDHVLRCVRRFFRPTPPRFILARFTPRRKHQKYFSGAIGQANAKFTEEEERTTTVLAIDGAEQTDGYLAIRIPSAQVAKQFAVATEHADEFRTLIINGFLTWEIGGCIKNASGQWHRMGGTGTGPNDQFVTFASREAASACKGSVTMFDFNNHEETLVLEKRIENWLDTKRAKKKSQIKEKERKAAAEAAATELEMTWQRYKRGEIPLEDYADYTWKRRKNASPIHLSI